MAHDSIPASSNVPATATTKQSTTNVNNKFSPSTHPLDPLTPAETNAITLSIRQYITKETEIKALKFVICSLLPPPKRDVLAYLGIPTTPGGQPEVPKPIVRRAEVELVDVINGGAYNVTVALVGEEWKVQKFVPLDKKFHPMVTVDELEECETVVQQDETIQALAKEVGIEPHQIFCDAWAIGYDERFPHSQRIGQAICFARLSPHENLYAHPLDFVPVVDSNLKKVIHIDFPPSYKKTENGYELSAPTTAPPALDDDPLKAANRERIPPPMRSFDFLPDLMAKSEEGFELRKDLKPLHIVQPEGVSFKMNGHVLEWQNWKMHIAFSHREGIALSTITYNDHGEVRPIFYRLSLAEMVVPYGVPEHPHPRKFAFDTGEYGMGTMAKELSLGCDCLGQIHYLPGNYVTHNGSACIIENAICIHEEDAGVLWTHHDYRAGGRGHTVRRRRLVVSMVCTLANYEYIWNFLFYQDGSIEFEVRLTGILLVAPLKDGEPTPFGTTVAPNVNGFYHQHAFSIRVDPMIDGLNNSVVESDVLPLEAPTGSDANFAGNGFHVKDTILEHEAGRQYDLSKERRWKIVNPSRKHYASGKDVGYTISLKGAAMPVMAKPDSWTIRRAPFLRNTLWVCRDVEGEDCGSQRMWPAGQYVPQSREEPNDSIGKWVLGQQKIVDEDILVYLTVGTTHIPRPEDWPVMPVEHFSVTFKPNSFFKVNPSMDVPGAKDTMSVAAFKGSTENGDACCQPSNNSTCCVA
ncbi:copper amine oxidase [Coprinopsis cinerea AmutBmut pab1-1]|nr:copper amine oxidase [Coprinopsis cinerea AmutBmut pab1-1]